MEWCFKHCYNSDGRQSNLLHCDSGTNTTINRKTGIYVDSSKKLIHHLLYKSDGKHLEILGEVLFLMNNWHQIQILKYSSSSLAKLSNCNSKKGQRNFFRPHFTWLILHASLTFTQKKMAGCHFRWILPVATLVAQPRLWWRYQATDLKSVYSRRHSLQMLVGCASTSPRVPRKSCALQL